MFMDIDRLRAVLAAPMACLFLILTLCVFAVRRPVSTGIRSPMMHLRAVPLSNCEFNGFTLSVSADGTVSTHWDQIPLDRVPLITSEVTQYRTDRIVYVIADPKAPFGRLMDVVDRIAKVRPAVRAVVVTPETQVDFSLGRVPKDAHFLAADRCRFEVTGADD